MSRPDVSERYFVQPGFWDGPCFFPIPPPTVDDQLEELWDALATLVNELYGRRAA